METKLRKLVDIAIRTTELGGCVVTKTTIHVWGVELDWHDRRTRQSGTYRHNWEDLED